MIHTLILPGLEGSPVPHWQHWWAQRDPHALLVEQRDWTAPTPEAWEAEIAGAVLTHPDCILVGHSLGAVVAVRLLTKWPQLRVRGTLLVAPTEPQVSPKLSRFHPMPLGALRIPATVVASRNDPWMSFARARELSRSWEAALLDLGLAGHINTASGFGPWPLGLALRDELLEPGRATPMKGLPLCQARRWCF